MASGIYLIFGDEYIVSTKAKQTAESLVPPESRAFGLEIIDGTAENVDSAMKAVDKCLEAIQTVGFMGNSKVVWFRNVNFLHDSVTGKSEDVKERVERLAEVIKKGLPEGQTLIISSSKVDKRHAFYKACSDAANVQEFAVPEKTYQSDKQAAQMASDCFRKAGLRPESGVQELFLEKVGSDTRQIVNEVEKLSVYLGGRKEVRLADINAITSSSREVLAWDLADAFGKRNLKQAILVLRQLLFQKESSMRLIIGLEGRVRDLMLYREAMDNGWLISKRGGYGPSVQWNVPPEIDGAFAKFDKDPRKGNPFRMGILAEQAKKFTARELQKCRKAVLEAHEKLVSSDIPEQTILEPLLVKMIS